MGHENRVSCLGVSNDGISLCTGSWDSLVRISYLPQLQFSTRLTVVTVENLGILSKRNYVLRDHLSHLMMLSSPKFALFMV